MTRQMLMFFIWTIVSLLTHDVSHDSSSSHFTLIPTRIWYIFHFYILRKSTRHCKAAYWHWHDSKSNTIKINENKGNIIKKSCIQYSIQRNHLATKFYRFNYYVNKKNLPWRFDLDYWNRNEGYKCFFFFDA